LRPPFLAVAQEASAIQQARSNTNNEEGFLIITTVFTIEQRSAKTLRGGGRVVVIYAFLARYERSKRKALCGSRGL
jgi:hypothetical protein